MNNNIYILSENVQDNNGNGIQATGNSSRIATLKTAGKNGTKS